MDSSLPPILAQAVDRAEDADPAVDLRRLRRLFAWGYGACLALTLGLYALFAWHQYGAERERLDAQLAFDTRLLASATAGRLGQFTTLSDAVARDIRRNPQLLGDPASLRQRLLAAQADMPGVAVIRVVSAQGQVLSATSDLGAGFEMRNNPQIWAVLLRARSSGRVQLAPLTYVPALGRWVLPQLRWYPPAGGAPGFWVGVGIDRNDFSRFWAGMMNRQMRAESVREAEGFVLVRQDGWVLARWPDVPAERFQGFYGRPQNGILVRTLQESEGRGEGAYEGVVHSLHQYRLGYWIRLGGEFPGLAVSVSVPQPTLWQGYLRALLPTTVAAALIGLMLTVAYLLLRQRLRGEERAIAARHQALLDYNAQLRQLAEHDYLTSLPNRRYLMAQLRRLCGETARFAVGLIDLDDFKQVNDTRGHAEGDQFLKLLARRLQGVLREGDTLVRLGGDEFAVLLLGVNQERDALIACQRVLDTARTRLELSPRDAVQVTASIGVAVYPEDGTNPQDLMRHADLAMYDAKQAGKNIVRRFAPRMAQAALDQQAAYDLLRQALAQEWLRLYYQPVLGLCGPDAGKIVGVEALLRILHPERGLLPAQSFVSALDAPHLARPVGRWVLQQALGQAQFWNAQGLVLRMMVNISPQHFLGPDWLDDLREVMAGHPGVRREQVKIEITESGAMRDLASARRLMEASAAQGVQLALDDFGQGETTLRYLQHLPLQVIKIDQAFVRDMIDDPRDYAIVSGLLHMAMLLGVTAVAEGVEDLVTLNLLAAQGCSQAQGYGIARPMPAEDIAGWIAGWRPPVLDPVQSLARPNLPAIQRQRFARLRAAAAGRVPFPQRVTEANAEQTCHLGLWLNGTGRFFFGHNPGYAALHEQHARIHALGRLAKIAAEAGNPAEAQRLIAEAEAINDALLAALARMDPLGPV